MFPRLLSRLAALSGVCCLFLPLLAAAQENNAGFTNWPMPSPPPAGTNTAAYPVPRNDWMVHFAHNVERVKGAQVDFVWDGDSITDGWQGAGKTVWARNYDKRNATDFGIGGDHTEHVLWRLERGQVSGLHPKLIALMIGTNNLAANTDEQIAEAIGVIVKDYQKRCPDAVILLQAIFPRAEKPTDGLRTRIKNINAAIAQLGDGKKVIFLDFGDKFLQPDGTLSRDIMPDFLHPNAKGYEIWADAIRPVVEKVLGPEPAA